MTCHRYWQKDWRRWTTISSWNLLIRAATFHWSQHQLSLSSFPWHVDNGYASKHKSPVQRDKLYLKTVKAIWAHLSSALFISRNSVVKRNKSYTHKLPVKKTSNELSEHVDIKKDSILTFCINWLSHHVIVLAGFQKKRWQLDIFS